MLKDSIDIWLINLNARNYRHALNVSCLLPELETKKWNNFIFAKDQKRYLISHTALRLILSMYINITPKDIRYRFNSYGKPYIADNYDTYFNLSYSGKMACVAVSHHEIGVDIEYITSDFDYAEIVDYYFTARESNLVTQQKTDINKLKMFFRIWTIKEALLKATGSGLVNPLPNIIFNSGIWQSIDAKYAVWEIKRLNLLEEGYIASIAYQKGKSAIINYKCFRYQGSYE